MYMIVKFGSLTPEQQIEILKKFKNENEEIFYHYSVPGLRGMSQEEIEIYIKDAIEYISDDYFNGILPEYDEVKNIIDKRIEFILNEYLNSKKINTNCLADLINNVNKGDFGKIDKKTQYNIKYAITYEILKNDYNKKEFEEMKKKKVYVNHVMFDTDGRHDDYLETWWYKIETESDEKLWNMLLGNCADSYVIIGDRNKPFDDYSYALVYMESAEDYDLLIYTNKDMEFENIIKPKIEKINTDIVIEKADKYPY